MLDSKLNCGFATASGKGMTCSISSHLKAQDLLSTSYSNSFIIPWAFDKLLTENVNLFPDAVENPPSWMCPFITGSSLSFNLTDTLLSPELTFCLSASDSKSCAMKELEYEVDVQEQAVDTNSINDNYNTCLEGKSGGGFSSASGKGILFSHPNLSKAENLMRGTEGLFSIRLCAFDKIFSERGISFPDAVENPPQQSTPFSLCSLSFLLFLDRPILVFSF
jgi:hypothetical protein